LKAGGTTGVNGAGHLPSERGGTSRGGERASREGEEVRVSSANSRSKRQRRNRHSRIVDIPEGGVFSSKVALNNAQGFRSKQGETEQELDGRGEHVVEHCKDRKARNQKERDEREKNFSIIDYAHSKNEHRNKMKKRHISA